MLVFIEILHSSGGVFIVEGLVQQCHLGHQCLIEIAVTIEDLADRLQVGGRDVVGIGNQIACRQNAEYTDDNQGKRGNGKRKCDLVRNPSFFSGINPRLRR